MVKGKRIFFNVLIIAFMLGIVGFFVYDIVVNKRPVDTIIFRFIAILCALVATLIRLNRGQGSARLSLNTYETKYGHLIGSAFSYSPFWRKKLLCAMRLMDEGDGTKALKYLRDLNMRCQNIHDLRAVLMWSAFTYTSMGMPEQAIDLYYKLLGELPEDAEIHNRLGMALSSVGNYALALQHYKKALSVEPNGAHICNNIAQCYFKQYMLDEAVEFAQRALEIDSGAHKTKELLAVLYALKGDEENRNKYFHMAIAAGSDAQELKETIRSYRSMHETIGSVQGSVEAVDLSFVPDDKFLSSEDSEDFEDAEDEE